MSQSGTLCQFFNLNWTHNNWLAVEHASQCATMSPNQLQLCKYSGIAHGQDGAPSLNSAQFVFQYCVCRQIFILCLVQSVQPSWMCFAISLSASLLNEAHSVKVGLYLQSSVWRLQISAMCISHCPMTATVIDTIILKSSGLYPQWLVLHLMIFTM